VLDEPTSGLDHDATTAVLALLAEAHCTVIIATHDPLVVTWCQSELPLE
jgi:ABC-type bacteriocin/lantibiotic exporter with double-glycine peptidase domain